MSPPPLPSLHFLSQATSPPRVIPSGPSISFRGNPTTAYKGACPAPKDKTQLSVMNTFPKPLTQLGFLSVSYLEEGQSPARVPSGLSLPLHCSPEQTFSKGNTKPERKYNMIQAKRFTIQSRERDIPFVKTASTSFPTLFPGPTETWDT